MSKLILSKSPMEITSSGRCGFYSKSLNIEPSIFSTASGELFYLSIYLAELLASYYIRSYYIVVTCVNSIPNNGGLS